MSTDSRRYRSLFLRNRKSLVWTGGIPAALAAIVAGLAIAPAFAADAPFGPSNPFYAPSTLPFQAPPFDKIKDADYQPAIEAGMAQQLKEIAGDRGQSCAADVREHDRRDGKDRAAAQPRDGASSAASPARTLDPELQKVKDIEAPKLAAHQDAIYLNPKLFAARRGDLQAARFAEARSGIAAPGRVSTTRNSCMRARTSPTPTRRS